MIIDYFIKNKISISKLNFYYYDDDMQAPGARSIIHEIISGKYDDDDDAAIQAPGGQLERVNSIPFIESLCLPNRVKINIFNYI